MKKRMVNEFGFLSQEYVYFRLVYEQGSVNGAARKISQDAGNLSRSISRLEEKIQSKLFVRHKNGLEPNDAAHRLYMALAQAQSQFLRHLGRSFHVRRSIRIGFSSTIGYVHFSAKYLMLLAKLEMQPEFSIASSAEVIESLKARKLDFALVNYSVKFPALIAKRVATEDLVLCAGKPELQKCLLVHPDMLGLERIIQSIPYDARWVLKDYFMIANFLRSSPALMGIIPEGLLATHKSLNVLRRFPSEGKITALSWPGSIGVELVRSLK